MLAAEEVRGRDLDQIAGEDGRGCAERCAGARARRGGRGDVGAPGSQVGAPDLGQEVGGAELGEGLGFDLSVFTFACALAFLHRFEINPGPACWADRSRIAHDTEVDSSTTGRRLRATPRGSLVPGLSRPEPSPSPSALDRVRIRSRAAGSSSACRGERDLGARPRGHLRLPPMAARARRLTAARRLRR